MEQQNPIPEAPSLALTDLVLLLNLIRVTSERGAIKAEEMSAVGAVYEKLVKFLEASGAIKSATTEASADESAQ
jgi:hypothetical protein